MKTEAEFIVVMDVESTRYSHPVPERIGQKFVGGDEGRALIWFGGLVMMAGTPPYLAALSLGFFSNLNASITHYGTGPAPIYFGAGYVDLGAWWKLGFLVSVVNLVIWLGAGSIWWRILGLW